MRGTRALIVLGLIFEWGMWIMKRSQTLVISLAVAWVQGGVMAGSNCDDLYAAPKGVQTRWVSFENPTGSVGAGGKENKGAKGHPYDRINAGETKVMLNVKEKFHHCF